MKAEYKTKFEETCAQYVNKYGVTTITPYTVGKNEQEETQSVTVYMVETKRTILKPLYSQPKEFNEYSQQIKQLYFSTFGNEEATSLYMDGKPHTEESFQKRVNLQSERWVNGYPFAAFVIEDKEKSEISEHNVVAGYGVIGNGCKPNAAEMALLLAKDFQGKELAQESGGALTFGYGKYLYDLKSFVNKGLPTESVFERIVATTNVKNEVSNVLLEKAGFETVGQTEKWDSLRNEWELKYTHSEIITYNLEKPVEISGIVELWSESSLMHE